MMAGTDDKKIVSRFIMEGIAAAGAPLAFTLQTNVPWKCHSLAVSPESIPFFVIDRVDVAYRPQMAAPGAVPAAVFGTVGCGAFLELDAATPGQYLTIIVRNVDAAPRPFYGWADGMGLGIPRGAIAVVGRYREYFEDDFAGIREAIKGGCLIRTNPRKSMQ